MVSEKEGKALVAAATALSTSSEVPREIVAMGCSVDGIDDGKVVRLCWIDPLPIDEELATVFH